MQTAPQPAAAELPTSGQLARSTLIAVVLAALALVVVVLPAEYGIDPTRAGRSLGLTQMGEIKTQLSAEAEADRRMQAVNPCGEQKSDLSGPSLVDFLIGRAQAATPSLVVAQVQKGEMSVTLKPGQGIEIKLSMKKGAKVNYAWKAAGGVVNHDTHGEPPGSNTAHSYKRANGVAGDQGVLEAAFDGNHGWFWRNRSQSDVTVTIQVDGDYSEMKRVM